MTSREIFEHLFLRACTRFEQGECQGRRIGAPHRADTSDCCVAWSICLWCSIPKLRAATPHRNGIPAHCL